MPPPHGCDERGLTNLLPHLVFAIVCVKLALMPWWKRARETDMDVLHFTFYIITQTKRGVIWREFPRKIW